MSCRSEMYVALLSNVIPEWNMYSWLYTEISNVEFWWKNYDGEIIYLHQFLKSLNIVAC